MAWKESDYSQNTLTRLARAGAWVRLIVQPDACPVCQSHRDQVYTPDQSPRLPLPGCALAYCRCRFEAVDPASKLPVSELVRRSATLIQAGQRALAEKALRHAVRLDELNEPAWLWLSAAVEGRERAVCLERVLSINPQNTWAQTSLQTLHQQLGIESGNDPPAHITDMPMQVLEIRSMRQIMIEQWQAFMQVIPEVAPKIAYDQAMAFIHGLERANAQAIDLLFNIPSLRDETEQQLRELDLLGRSLGQAMRTTTSRPLAPQNLQASRAMFDALFKELLTRRQILRKQVSLYGGQ